MDIHRCRFVDWPPSPINALAFSQSTGPSGRGPPLRLAVGRANGNIEIWDPRGGLWVHETTFYGGHGRSVEGLAWTTDPDESNDAGKTVYGRLRLFSIGYSDTVTEWDLTTGTPLRQSSGSHNDVWCMAAQPRLKKEKREHAKTQQVAQDIAVGCADGSLLLLSTADEDLTFKKYITRTSRKTARALSIAWQTTDRIVAGFSDSSARVYNTVTNETVRTIGLGGGPKGGPREKLCWAIQPLADGTIVTADSSGEICWWDAKTYGQLQKIQAHEADALCLTASANGKTVMSGGMDRRSCVFRLGDNKRWAKVDQKRVHQHDVKAMTSFENDKMSVAVSGGVDASPVFHPLRQSGEEYHRALPYTPQTVPIVGAQRLVVSWWANEVNLWRVRPRPTGGDEEEWGRRNYTLVARLALKGDEHIVRAAITQGGDLLAVSTSAQIKLFQLRRSHHSSEKLKVKKIEAPGLLKHGAKLLEFSADSKWLLAIDVFNAIRVYRVLFTSETQTIAATSLSLSRVQRQPLAQTCLNGAWGSYSRTITRAAFSNDSRVLVVSDLEGYIDSWLLEGEEDLALENGQNGNTNGHVSDSEDDPDDNDKDNDSDSSDSEEDSDNNPLSKTLYGQRWVLNPKTRSLPKLASQPLVLSFITNPSRSGSFPSDTLVTLTATHELQIFSIRTGALHSWSRRNPSSILPADFKLHRDRAVGCVWDVAPHEQRFRAWLYGANWLCMFDFGRDLPLPDVQSVEAATSSDTLAETNGDKAVSRKRKREDPSSSRKRADIASAELARKKGASGAGSRVKEGENGAGIDVRSLTTLDSEGRRSAVVIDTDRKKKRALLRNGLQDGADDPDDESEDDENADTGLIQLRRDEASQQNDMSLTSEANGDDHHLAQNHASSGSSHRAFYITSRYRPILGIVPLSPSEDPEMYVNGMPDGVVLSSVESERRRRTFEVAVVERPAWEVDLPPRFGAVESDR